MKDKRWAPNEYGEPLLGDDGNHPHTNTNHLLALHSTQTIDENATWKSWTNDS
jgi:hypothetical protein